MSIAFSPRPATEFLTSESDGDQRPVPVFYPDDPHEESFGVAHSAFLLGKAPRVAAVTDQGLQIPLFHYEAVITPATGTAHRFDPSRDLQGLLAMIERCFLKKGQNPGYEMQRLTPLNPSCNCHGWVFAGGYYGVHNEDVRLILGQHAYNTVREPKSGDLVIYRSEGEIVHSGFVRIDPLSGEIMIESKWGPFGVFLHAPAAYCAPWTYFHTARPRHMLRIQEVPA